MDRISYDPYNSADDHAALELEHFDTVEFSEQAEQLSVPVAQDIWRSRAHL